MFSLAVLVALYVAVPCGLIMHEPFSATISTLVGAVVFSLYILWSIKKKRISKARIGLSFVVVLIFLPAMFFTNGGVSGGTPIWLLLGIIYVAIILTSFPADRSRRFPFCNHCKKHMLILWLFVRWTEQACAGHGIVNKTYFPAKTQPVALWILP